MIRKALKWIGLVLGSLIGLRVLTLLVLYFIGTTQVDKTHNIQPEAIAIPTDADAIARGEHIATIRACNNCHTETLSGQLIFNNPTSRRGV